MLYLTRSPEGEDNWAAREANSQIQFRGITGIDPRIRNYEWVPNRRPGGDLSCSDPPKTTLNLNKGVSRQFCQLLHKIMRRRDPTPNELQSKSPQTASTLSPLSFIK